MPVDEPQACKHHQKKFFRDDYQFENYLLRKLGSVYEFLKYCCDLTIAIETLRSNFRCRRSC